MGINNWMDRKPSPQEKKFSMEDYPGYTDGILECLRCEARFEGLFDLEPEKIVCPRCGNQGVKVVCVVKKIWLQ